MNLQVDPPTAIFNRHPITGALCFWCRTIVRDEGLATGQARLIQSVSY